MRGSKLIKKMMKNRSIWIKERTGWKQFEIESFEFRNDKLAIITKGKSRIIFLEDIVAYGKERYKI